MKTWTLDGPGVEVIGAGGDCPTCGWEHGFHDPIAHAEHEVPRELVWAPGDTPRWKDAGDEAEEAA